MDTHDVKTGYENLVGMYIKDITTRGATCEISATDISFGKYEQTVFLRFIFLAFIVYTK